MVGTTAGAPPKRIPRSLLPPHAHRDGRMRLARGCASALLGAQCACVLSTLYTVSFNYLLHLASGLSWEVHHGGILEHHHAGM